MSYGEEMATGVICRACLLPLKGAAPGHSRLCPDCFDLLVPLEDAEPWEIEAGPARVDYGEPEPAPRVTPNQQSVTPTGAPAPEEP